MLIRRPTLNLMQTSVGAQLTIKNLQGEAADAQLEHSLATVAAETLAQIRVIIIENSSLTDRGIALLLEKASHVVSLHLHNTQITDEVIYVIVRISSLEFIGLNANANFYGTTLGLLKQLGRLKKLNLYDSNSDVSTNAQVLRDTLIVLTNPPFESFEYLPKLSLYSNTERLLQEEDNLKHVRYYQR